MTRPLSGLHERLPGDPLEVLVIDLLARLLGEVERVENLQRLADIARAFFRIERAVGGEHHLVERKEREPAHGRRMRAEYRGVAIEVLLEIIERPFLRC